MKTESLAKIFNSTQREVEETSTYKCFYTFCFNDAQNTCKDSFGRLEFLNNAFLAPGENITYKHEENTRVIILPLTGALNYHTAIHEKGLVKSEQVQVIGVEKEASYTLNNPFEKEWVNYLHIGFNINASTVKPQSALRNIEFKKMDELVCFDFNSQEQPSGYVGIYQGRSKDGFALRNSANGVFVYIINGAFEVQGRLLEQRDGLGLWNTNEIEFEALSNNAIIMILEIELT